MRQVDYSSFRKQAPLPPSVLAERQGTASSEIKVGPDGRIQGVDGMLDQIAGALAKHAGPMIVSDVLPAVREDERLQARIGAAVGQAVAQELKPWFIVGAVGVAAIGAGVVLWARRARR